MNTTIIIIFTIVQKLLIVYIYYLVVKSLTATSIKLYYSYKLIKALQISELRYDREVRDIKQNLPILFKEINYDLGRVNPKYYIEYLLFMFFICIMSLILLTYLFFDGLLFHRDILDMLTNRHDSHSSLLIISTLKSRISNRVQSNNPYQGEEYNYDFYSIFPYNSLKYYTDTYSIINKTPFSRGVINRNPRFIQVRHYHNKPIFNEYYYPANLALLREKLLLESIDSFNENIVDNKAPNDVVRVIIVIQYLITGEDSSWYEYRSLTRLETYDRTSYNWFKAIALHRLEEKSNYYYDHPVEHIIFRYRVEREEGFKPKALLIDGPLKPARRFTFDNYNLPLPNTSDFNEFGIILKVFHEEDISKEYEIPVPNKDIIISVITHGNWNEIEIIRSYEGIETRTYVRDFLTDRHNPRTFTRVSDGREYFFIDGNLEVRTIERKTEYLKPLKKSKKIKENAIITMDLETRKDSNGVMTPYLLCFYDGKKSFSYYLEDYNGSVDDMMFRAISDLFKTKYNNKIIYLHNFSSFDGIFLIGYFHKIHNVVGPGPAKILKMESKFIEVSLTIRFNNKNLTIKFRDSFLLLPESLKKLGETFKVESKGVFPVFFPNDNSLNYQGVVPDYKYFSKLSLEEYNHFKSEFKGQWVLKDEAIKYCIQDCKTLYQVLVRFNELIFTNFNVNVWKYPTLPSLAVAIYRTGYIDNFQIPITTGVLFEELKAGWGYWHVYPLFW